MSVISDGAMSFDEPQVQSSLFPDLEDAADDAAALPPPPLALDALDFFSGDLPALDPGYVCAHTSAHVHALTHTLSHRFQHDRMMNTVAQISAEQGQLLALVSQAPLGSAARTQLMHSLGEVSARLSLYQQSMAEL